MVYRVISRRRMKDEVGIRLNKVEEINIKIERSKKKIHPIAPKVLTRKGPQHLTLTTLTT
jgi:hypothetical protein